MIISSEDSKLYCIQICHTRWAKYIISLIYKICFHILLFFLWSFSFYDHHFMWFFWDLDVYIDQPLNVITSYNNRQIHNITFRECDCSNWSRLTIFIHCNLKFTTITSGKCCFFRRLMFIIFQSITRYIIQPREEIKIIFFKIFLSILLLHEHIWNIRELLSDDHILNDILMYQTFTIRIK